MAGQSELEAVVGLEAGGGLAGAARQTAAGGVHFLEIRFCKSSIV